MLFTEAQRTVAQFLAPLTLDEFLDSTLAGGFRKLDGDGRSRTDLLGPDPAATLLSGFHLAPRLTYHSANATGPAPSLQGVRDAAEFAQRIEQFHARNYSVRFPELRPLSPALDRLARAFEILFHQPVVASAFWSRGGMRAPVHYDDHDIIIVQLRGTKRWYISRDPPGLNNTWETIPDRPPELGNPATVDLSPGDLLYVPRGTPHSVDSDTESLHLAIGFTPLTVRAAVIAVLDHLSDLSRPLRQTIGGRLAFQLNGSGSEQLAPPILDALARLTRACQTPGFIAAAMLRRSARTVATLQPLPQPRSVPAIDLDTPLVQRPTAFCHLTMSPEKMDFSYPGGHVYIHRGAQESVFYMVSTPRFRPRDIPGAIGDDVRLSLATKFLQVGFLEVASESR